MILKTMLLKFQCACNPCGESLNQVWDLRFCTPYQFPGDTAAGGLSPALWVARSEDTSRSVLPIPGSLHTTHSLHFPIHLPPGSFQLLPYKYYLPGRASLKLPTHYNHSGLTLHDPWLLLVFLPFIPVKLQLVFVWLLDYVDYSCHTVGFPRSGTILGFA